MLDPITFTIEVPCNQQQAFETFADIGSWWPLDKRSASMRVEGQTAKSVSLTPKSGGKVIEVTQDGTEYLWGTVRDYNPNELFSMEFHMGLPPVDPASLVEVRFTVVDDERTRVELTQSNWEAFGDMAEMMRGGYGGSWGLLFEEAYKAACAG
ncbi:MAG: hypothetical protein GXP04_10640 [Alphaproteobacteria bacterium]|nr:SRPBCC domain-containing protein [Marinicaulis sp.]NOX95520.1 hypothetical protein [Alphaproteobacteria bacterium]